MLILLGIQAGTAQAQYAGEATVLSPSDDRIGFGLSLAIRNDVLLVGAPFDTVSDSVSAGAVYVYRRTGPGAWSSEARLTADDLVSSEDLFGSSVSLESYTDRELAAVGSGSGAYVFQHDQGQWSRVQRLVGGQGRDSFGGSVSLSDSNLVVSSSFDVPRGSISIFRLSHDGLFEESARFEQQEVGLFIGQPSLVWGGTVVVGTDGYESYAGRVYSYRLSDTGWTFFEQLDTDDTVRVFAAIALRDSMVAIQGYDDGPCCEYVHVFRHGTDGWHSVARIDAPTEQGALAFGQTISLSKRHLFVGSSSDSQPVRLAGAVYMYDRADADWSQATKITPSELVESSNFGGRALSTDDQTLVVSAKTDNEIVYLFDVATILRTGARDGARAEPVVDAYPNPFRSTLTIEYEVPIPGLVRIEAFDVTGRRVTSILEEHRPSGSGSTSWSPGTLAPGVYIVTLSINSDTSAVVVMRS